MKPLRDKGYRNFLHDVPCSVCWSQQSEACHTQNNGMGSKGPDSSCAPLCHKHHMEYDSGRKAFEAGYGVDMKAIAAIWWQRYLQKKKVA